MRALSLAALCAIIAVAVWLWGYDGARHIAHWAADGQRDVQNAMAGQLQALKRGEAGAVLGLWTLCFAYGFFHAAGPGHGKMVIGGYGFADAVPMKRLALLAVASSLAQAGTAIVLVYAGIWLLGWGREQMQVAADQWMAPLSYALIGMVGLWLAFRGARKLWRGRRATGSEAPGSEPHPACEHAASHAYAHAHAHVHAQSAVCASCGHAHGPSLEEAARVRSLRDGIAVVAAVAVRPCTGALFLLILTWRMGIDLAGIAGALIMGLGTATITVLVAVLSVSLRQSVTARWVTGAGALRAAALIELTAGVVVVVLATQMLMLFA